MTVTDRIRTQLEVIDERFRGCQGDEWVECLYAGGRWTEGPAYFPAGRYLLFSDIPNDRMLRFDELTGVIGEFRAPAGYANGNTVDRQGRLLSCEQGHRRVTRTRHDGSVTVLTDRYDGKRLNSPNDLVERSDGSIWFTDPSYRTPPVLSNNDAGRLTGLVKAPPTSTCRPGRTANGVSATA